MRAFAGRLLALLMMLGLSAATAAAQPSASPVNVTAFTGAAMAPDAQSVSGIGVGLRPHPGPLSIEFEYSKSQNDPNNGLPAIMTFAGNLLFQVPVQQSRLELYGTLGVGFYALESDDHSSEPNDARNFGGGAKVTLGNHLKLRIDYRVFLLSPISNKFDSNEHRVSLGIVAGF